MPDSHSLYRSYLLRLRCDNAESTWLASVQDILTNEIRHFAQPEELWAFLQAEMINEHSPTLSKAESAPTGNLAK